jgi:hypothetical protein
VRSDQTATSFEAAFPARTVVLGAGTSGRALPSDLVPARGDTDVIERVRHMFSRI